MGRHEGQWPDQYHRSYSGLPGFHPDELVVLDRQFSTDVTIQDGHRLITGRPYRYIRHPRYLGIIVFLAGISLVFRSWFALCLTAEVLLVLIWCIHDEEKLMHQEFRDEWEQHREKTFSLFPFIY
jgi:protein-S-isoprenylcysteine O-methyltransferase Ste14